MQIATMFGGGAARILIVRQAEEARLKMADTAEARIDQRRRLIEVARGKRPADLVLTNARIANVFSHELVAGDIAVYAGRVAGLGPVGSYGG
ncbi:MAG: hypothetical protein C5B60_03430, partial [Chloroflexi bacterium]